MRALTLVCLLLLIGASACARDCATLVERRCGAANLDPAACARLVERAAAVPPQACEAVLRALESGAHAR